MIRRGRVLALEKRGAVLDATGGTDFHVRSDFGADAVGRHAQMRQRLHLSGCRAAAMAAHGRKHVGTRARRGHRFRYASDQERQMGDAAAAAANGHALAGTYRIQQCIGLESLTHSAPDIRHGGARKILPALRQGRGQRSGEIQMLNLIEKKLHAWAVLCRERESPGNRCLTSRW